MQYASARRSDPFEHVHSVPADQLRIDAQLANWGRWCKGGRGAYSASPMFRLAQSSNARTYGAPTAPPAINEAEARQLELTVRQLPELQRELLRAWYVSNVSPARVCHALHINRTELTDELHRARRMAAARLAQLTR